MARPREFDEADVLDRAMLQFWRHGFEGTSIHDLVDATGVGRQSLYNTFGDKHAIFLKALDRYESKTAALLTPLLADDAGLQQVRDYVAGAMKLQKSSRCNGCLVVRSALELGTGDPQIRTAIARTGKLVRAGLTNALDNAIRTGEIKNSSSGADLASYVFTTLNGLAGLLGTGAGERQTQRVIDLLFESLDRAA
ncbi:MAG: TetR/AcrR family transcriptional regulator [bacterium]|nr:TetR/AcrR family transcriptional regulator [bacterium]